MWFRGIVYMATTSDDRVWAYDTRTREIEVLYDGVALGEAAPLHDTDNLTISERSGDMFVCEDPDDLDVCIVTPEGKVARFAQLTGSQHSQSELTGPVFDPSGTRFFVASQRAFGLGAVYEISARLLADIEPGKPAVVAEAERRLPSRTRRARIQLRPRKTAAPVAEGAVLRLVVRARFGSSRSSRFEAPVRLD